MTEQVLIDRIQQLVDKHYDVNFDYEVEHWDWGNSDDSYYYGRESGMNSLAGIINKLIKTHKEGGDVSNVAI